MRKINFSGIQQLGRALMLPIAVLPAAALLLRFGQADLLNLAFMASAGAAIFDNLGILFAIGIAVGFARENNGAAGLAGVVGYFVVIKGAGVLLSIPPDIVEGAARAAFLAKEASRMSIPVGIVTGLSAGLLYNHFYMVRLPDYLSFFGGRRFVPIVTGFVCLGWAVLFGQAWPMLSAGLDTFSNFLSDSGDIGLFFYGVLNRLLIITGLHHILNNVVWFLHGTFSLVQDGVAVVVTGDLNRFSRGDPTAGAFMAGFFPVMMFGLPAACLAMFRNAATARRRAVGGVLLSMALTAFLTGITEPVEFAFMFLAPPLYAIHALLTGLSMVIMNALNVKLGFGFSAGFIDYVINFNKSTNPLLLLPVGAVYFAVYYFLFNLCIQKFDLATMGREPAAQEAITATASASPVPAHQDGLVLRSQNKIEIQNVTPAAARLGSATPKAAEQAENHVFRRNDLSRNNTDNSQCYFENITLGAATDSSWALIQALGGPGNILSIDTTASRLRLGLKNNSTGVDRNALRKLGVFGCVMPDENTLELVFGPLAKSVADSLRSTLAQGESALTAQQADSSFGLEGLEGDEKVKQMITALGGPENLRSVDACATRLRLKVRDNSVIDDAALKQLGAHGVVRPDKESLQVVLGPVADTVSSAIRELLRAWQTRQGKNK